MKLPFDSLGDTHGTELQDAMLWLWTQGPSSSTSPDSQEAGGQGYEGAARGFSQCRLPWRGKAPGSAAPAQSSSFCTAMEVSAFAGVDEFLQSSASLWWTSTPAAAWEGVFAAVGKQELEPAATERCGCHSLLWEISEQHEGCWERRARTKLLPLPAHPCACGFYLHH